jgi:hypothetical protein
MAATKRSPWPHSSAAGSIRLTSRCSMRPPGAMIYFINGLQWAGYKHFDWGVVGESACADS